MPHRSRSHEAGDPLDKTPIRHTLRGCDQQIAGASRPAVSVASNSRRVITQSLVWTSGKARRRADSSAALSACRRCNAIPQAVTQRKRFYRLSAVSRLSARGPQTSCMRPHASVLMRGGAYPGASPGGARATDACIAPCPERSSAHRLADRCDRPYSAASSASADAEWSARPLRRR